MLKIILLILIFANISTKTIPTLEYDTLTDFKEGNSEFNIESSGEITGLLTYVNIQNKKLKISFLSDIGHSTSYGEHIFTNPGGAFAFFFPTDTINTMNITSEDGEEIKEGTIWIHPLDLELNSDLSEKIIKLYPAMADMDYETLNYTISDLKEDTTVRLTYEKEYKENGIEIKDLANPFSVCEDYFCLDDIDSFTFVKGNSYTIRLKFEKKIIKVDGEDRAKYFLPAFSFYKIDPKILKYGEKTIFNKDDNIFKFEYSGKSTGFLTFVDTKNKNLNITYVSKKSFTTAYESHIFKSPGGGCIFYVTKNCNNILHIEPKDEPFDEQGTIWIYPINNDINIDLLYGINNSYTVMYDEDFGNLTFSASKVQAVSEYLIFNYVKEYKDENIEIKDLKNPFKICEGEVCKENINKYKIKEGANYTIHIKYEERTVKINGKDVKRYFLPGHSFEYELKKSAGFLGFSLMYFMILLLLF